MSRRAAVAALPSVPRTVRHYVDPQGPAVVGDLDQLYNVAVRQWRARVRAGSTHVQNTTKKDKTTDMNIKMKRDTSMTRGRARLLRSLNTRLGLVSRAGNNRMCTQIY